MNSETSMFSPEEFLQVPPSMACAIGLNEAIVLQHVFWLSKNPRNGRVIDGDRWIYNTYEEWQEQYFPFWKPRTIKHIFQQLEKIGYMVSCQPEGGISRRKYYRVSRAAIANLTIERFQNSHGKVIEGTSGGPSTNHPMSLPITETTTETTSRRVPDGTGSRTSSRRPPAISYPRTEAEMERILEENGTELDGNGNGNFFEQMVKAGWRIKGKPIKNWIKVYQARMGLVRPE